MNHGLRDARQGPDDRLRVETAGDQGVTHRVYPCRRPFGADVAVLMPPQQATLQIVGICTAAAEPLCEKKRGVTTVEVRKRFAQQFVPLDAMIEILDQRSDTLRAADRLPNARGGISHHWLTAMAEFFLKRGLWAAVGSMHVRITLC